MSEYTTVLFDLDGTLTDPGIGITNSVMHALRKFDIEENDRTKLYKFIGPPLMESFGRYYGFSKEDCEKAVTYYREYFSVKGLFENEVYAGIPELLRSLKEAGKTVVLATSKPHDFSVEILKHFGLHKYFDFCACATMDEKRTAKDEVIDYALLNIRETDRSKIVMVGDRMHDIIGAKKCGLPSVGVLFGYGSLEELEEAGADLIAESVEKLGTLLI
ncbi:MAG: HAD family hydrolase [Lachnospiraceae bacterium]|nr:HAD family hydrolase [Lachnospiraceae bacterium]